MDWVLAEIRGLGYSKVILWVLEENTRAQRFYEKYGKRWKDEILTIDL